MLPPLSFATVFTRWQFAPIVTAFVVVFAALYLWGVIRVRRRHPNRPWPLWRTCMFLAGLLVVVMATESGIGSYDDILFWDHMIQHLMLIMVAPPLLVTGQPATLLLHASRNPLHTQVKKLLRSRVITAMTFPAVGVVAYAVTIVGTHLTSFMNLVMQDDAIHNAEHVLYLVVGYLYFLPLVGREPLRWKLSYPVRLFLLFIAMPVDAFTGVVLGMSSSVPWSTMATMARPSWAPNALDDVHIGGGVMWVGGAAIMFVVIMFVFLGWSRDTRTSSRSGWLENARRANIGELVNAPVDRGDVDDDDHLDAYNAYLARLNGTDKH